MMLIKIRIDLSYCPRTSRQARNALSGDLWQLS